MAIDKTLVPAVTPKVAAWDADTITIDTLFKSLKKLEAQYYMLEALPWKVFTINVDNQPVEGIQDFAGAAFKERILNTIEGQFNKAHTQLNTLLTKART